MSNTSVKVQNLINAIRTQFEFRVGLGYLKLNPGASGSVEIVEEPLQLLIRFKHNENTSTLIVPVPFVENAVEYLDVNGVRRATCKYYNKHVDCMFDFVEAVYQIIIGNPLQVLPAEMHKSKSPVMQLIRFGYENNTLPLAVRKIQKQINYLVNRLPVYKTDLNSYVMNRRVTIIDTGFEDIVSPEERYNYQVTKNRTYFDRGWSSIGLSDGSLANFNYILSEDLRKLTPFGIKHHNPQRNLYSTLGMRGDEAPLLQTKYTAALAKEGVARSGWNLFTLFVDIPDVWEDQIMVDNSHSEKCVEYKKRTICYGQVVVFEGESISSGDLLYVSDAGDKKIFSVPCDSAKVESIKRINTTVGGTETEAWEVIVSYKRYLKDGTKITNLSANKGIIRFQDLGYAIDPRTGEKRKIDVIVSSKAVKKRKNFSQIIEASLNSATGEKPLIVEDDAEISTEALKGLLQSVGLGEENTWECYTYAGKLHGVCGKVFWGVTHDADDTLWEEGRAAELNGRGLRTSGLKFSTIEFRALTTRFGKDNAIEKEILSYSQGVADLQEQLCILRSKHDRFVNNAGIVAALDILPFDVEASTFYIEDALAGTIADPNGIKEGFYLKLPVKYQTVVSEDDKILCDGFPGYVPGPDVKIKENSIIDKIYVPYYNLRKCWKHDTGKFGVSDIAAAINNIIVMSHRHVSASFESIHLTMLYRAIFNYFKLVNKKMSTKTGEISTLGMSVRYPHSTKAAASLSNDLEPNVVQIYKDMAKELKVEDGDIVIVERFPCLGFMSIRPQKVSVTDDPKCKFTIRASKNSLGSMTLDFDGDNLYIASFHTEDAKKALKDEWENPNEHCYEQIQKFNAKMGTPRTKEASLSDYGIITFDTLTCDSHAEIVGKLTGVKSFTGPVVALAYNLLRVMENCGLEVDTKINCGIEVFMDTVANSVFKQKHGKTSLHKIVTDAVCTADKYTLIREGFDAGVSELVCSVIRRKASERGIQNLTLYHNQAIAAGRSNIINRIVREENKLYFTSRSNLATNVLLKNLASYKVVDIPSNIFNKIMAGKTVNLYA